MLNIFKDILNFIKYKKEESNLKRVIFVENENTYFYLKKIIHKYKKKTAIVSLAKLNFVQPNNHFYHFANKTIAQIFFLLTKIQFLYSSTPDLNNSIFRKSLFNKTRYIYIQHSPASLCMIYNEEAFKHFDFIQVINKNQHSDVLDMNKIFKKKIKPIKSRYFLIEELQKKNNSNDEIDFLIAPSWGSNFYQFDTHNKIFEILKRNKKKFIFRPHYMSIKKKEFDLKNIDLSSDLIDLSSSFNLNNYKNLISDWSGIFFEFLIIKKKKPYLINTKMKVNNRQYKIYSTLPIELELRNEITHNFELNELDKFENLISKNEIVEDDFSKIDKIIRSKFY